MAGVSDELGWGEPQGNLFLGGLNGVRAVHDVTTIASTQYCQPVVGTVKGCGARLGEESVASSQIGV